jgi:hypothetical protein
VWTYVAGVLRLCSWRCDARCHRLRGKASVSCNRAGPTVSASSRTKRPRRPRRSRRRQRTVLTSRNVPGAIGTRAPFGSPIHEPSVPPVERGSGPNQPPQASRPVKNGSGARLRCPAAGLSLWR